MNILQKFKEEKKYIQLLKHHDDIEKIYKKMKEDSANAICDYVEQITKTESYKKSTLDRLRNDAYTTFGEIGLLTILIQAINENSVRLCSEYDGSCDEEYQALNLDILNFEDDRIHHYIRENWRDGMYENCVCDMYYFSLVLEVSPHKDIRKRYYKSGVNVIDGENEHVDGDSYEYIYFLNSNFNRGILAYYEFIKNNLQEIKEILNYHIDSGKVDIENEYPA